MSSLYTNLFDDIPVHRKQEVSVMTAIRSGSYNYDTDYEYQKKEKAYLNYLQNLLLRKRAGERVDISAISSRLQQAGILDSEGNLAEIYRTGKRS